MALNQKGQKKSSKIENIKESQVHASPATQLEEYAITLDIKNNVIAELQNIIENNTVLDKQSSVINSQPLPILSEANVQLFWANSDMAFSEENSIKQASQLTSFPSLISFPLPENITEIHFFRLDIGDQIGLLNINEIEIKNTSGSIIWKWDKCSILYKNGFILIANNLQWPDKIVQLSVTNDPHFVLINEIPITNTDKEFTLNITLSTIEENQVETLYNTITSPLSYYPEKEFILFQEAQAALKTENQILLGELVSANSTLNALNETTTQLHQQIATAEISIQNLTANNNISTSEKQQLINQLAQKKELASKITEENKHLEQVISHVKNEQLQLNNSLLELQHTEKRLLFEISSTKETIKKQEIHLTESIKTLENFIGQLKDDKILFSNEITAKNNIINKLFEEKENTSKGLIEKEKRLIDITNEQNSLHTELHNKNIEIIGLRNEKKQLEEDAKNTTEQLSSISTEKNIKESEIAILKSDLSGKANEIIQIKNQNIQLEESSKHYQEQIANLLAEKKSIETELTNLNAHIANTTQQMGALINLSNEQQKKLTQLIDEYTTIGRHNVALENELNQIRKDKKILENSVNTLTSKVEQYTENYDKRNALQIGFKRLFGKSKITSTP